MNENQEKKQPARTGPGRIIDNVLRFIEAGSPGGSGLDRETEETRNVKMALGVLLLTTPLFAVFTVYNLRNAIYIPAALNIIMIITQCINICMLKKYQRRIAGLGINVALYGLYFYFALVLGGSDGSYALWVILFPIAAFSFLPLVSAVLACFLFFIGAVTIVTIGPALFPMHSYRPAILVRFSLVYAIMALTIYRLEKTRIELFRSLIERDERIIEEMKRASDAHRIAMNAVQVKSRFLASISHEIRTPLSLITGMVELARRERDPDLMLEYLADINDSSQHLLVLINNVLDYTKMESERFTLEHKPFSLPVLIGNVQKSFAAEYAGKGLTLESSCDPSMPAHFLGDVTRVRQIVNNLVSNSYKYTRTGGVMIAVRPGDAAPADGAPGIFPVRIEVTDTGIGIPGDKLEEIFMPFEQIATAVDRHPGVGLGLAIVKGLVELMNGTIGAYPAAGGGTSFCVELPLVPAMGVEIHASDSLQREEAHDFLSYNILLADDNPSIVKMVKAALEKTGHRVTCAGNGREAMSLLAAGSFDVVLIDVEMPVINGIEATRQIRAGEAGDAAAHVPIIAMTAHTLDEVEENCRAAGMNGIIKKPFELFSLSDDIVRILNHR